MKLGNKSSFGLLMTAAMLLTGCGSGPAYATYPVVGPYLTGKTAKEVYNAYLGEAPTTLNAIKSQSASNSTHLANFEDCLMMNDNYGILRLSLAKKAEKSQDSRTFKFTIRENVPWVQYDGTPYYYKGKQQFVSAEDFVTTAKQILDYNNDSEIYYMYTLFVENAWEYYLYTLMQKNIKESKEGWTDLKGDQNKQAEKLMEMIKDYSGQDANVITGADITDIKNFKRVGVKVDSDGKLVYTLNQPAAFFPTMLTYTPFTPINANFYKENEKTYGTNKDKILYCGPYVLSSFEATGLTYKKNKLYWDADSVHLNTINYSVVSANTNAADMRVAFDKGDVDGFGLSKTDEKGWEIYITGKDGTGTIQNPYSAVVNSRELDDVDYTWHYTLNLNRSTDPASWKNSTSDTLKGKGAEEGAAIIANTNKAMKIKDVRQLVLDGIDLTIYNESHNAPDFDEQYQINTFTPRGYVYDQTEKDYVDYYYEEYAEQKGITDTAEKTAVEQVKELVGPQTTKGVQFDDDPSQAIKPWLNIKTIRDNAHEAIRQYNAMNPSDQISLPIHIEYMGTGGISATQMPYEQKIVASWNERANGCTLAAQRVRDGIPLCSLENHEDRNNDGKITSADMYFNMELNAITNSSAWTGDTNNGYYTLGTWGWMGDYADPLTYVHCYVTNGEMAKQIGNREEFDNYMMEGGVLVKQEGHMFDSYNAKVAAAAAVNESLSARYEAFAEAEYQLLNELYVIKPLYMSTQGWTASVSRAAGYENPTAHYGLADHCLKGIWVLVDVPTGAERAAARELQKQKKAQALELVHNDTTNAEIDIIK